MGQLAKTNKFLKTEEKIHICLKMAHGENKKKEAESDYEEMEVIIKKTGFAAFHMDECDKDDHVIDSDESPIIAKAPKQTVKKGKKKQEEGEENVAEATNEGGKRDRKKKKKGKKAEEDDLEKALADLNIETKLDNEAGQKKKAKKERKKFKQQKEPKDSLKEDLPAPNEAPAEIDEKKQVANKRKKEAKDNGKKGKKPAK